MRLLVSIKFDAVKQNYLVFIDRAYEFASARNKCVHQKLSCLSIISINVQSNKTKRDASRSAVRAHSARSVPSEQHPSGAGASEVRVSVYEREIAHAYARYTQCMPVPALLYRNPDLSVQPTYYLFIRTVPGWSATWRNRLREFAEPAFLAKAPSELCFHSFRLGPLYLCPPVSPFLSALLIHLSFSLLLYSRPSFVLFFLNLYTLSHPSCPSLLFSECAVHRHSHSIASSILSPPPPPLRCVLLLLSLLYNQNNNNLLRNCFDYSSIWVTAGYPRLCTKGTGHLVIQWF